MRLSTRWTVFVLAICALLAPIDAAAQGDRVPADKTLSPFFFVEGGDPAIDRLPLKDTRVDVAIAGVIADVPSGRCTRIEESVPFMPATSFLRRRGRPCTA